MDTKTDFIQSNYTSCFTFFLVLHQHIYIFINTNEDTRMIVCNRVRPYYQCFFFRSTKIIYLLLYNTNFLKPKVNCYNGVLRHPLYNWWCKLSTLSILSNDFDFVDYNIMLKQLKSWKFHSHRFYMKIN